MTNNEFPGFMDNTEKARVLFENVFLLNADRESLKRKMALFRNCSSEQGIYMGTGDDNDRHSCKGLKKDFLNFMKSLIGRTGLEKYLASQCCLGCLQVYDQN